MPQLFSSRADRRLRTAAVIAAALALLIGGAAFAYTRSGMAWSVGVAAPQPIPFSHAVHTGKEGLGLDCGFCHAGTERGAEAGMPSAQTCLGCHEKVWNVTAQFAPLRAALASGQAVQWSSVSRLPDHVRFDHSAHTLAGIGCANCHGTVEAMPRTVKAETLSMGFCLDCHRNPPASGIPASTGPASATPSRSNPHGLQGLTYEHYGVQVSPLTRCSTCHR